MRKLAVIMIIIFFLTGGRVNGKEITQGIKERNQTAREFYTVWKSKYVVKNPYAKGAEQYYIWYSKENFHKNQSGNPVPVTVSEAHGFGMVIMVYMADYDKDAKKIYDGMYRFFKAHPSSIGKNLMSWQQSDNGKELIDTQGNHSAIDGDMDIAYSLLLADKKWGSKGTVNYKEEALNVLNDIMKYEINHTYWTPELGDWAGRNGQEGAYAAATRSSDFMMQYFKEFYQATNNPDWKKVHDQCYRIMKSIIGKGKSKTGLLPDFIIRDEKTGRYIPAPAYFLEGKADGWYSYNACRTPFRIGLDYVVYGDKNAEELLKLLNSWVIKSTGGDPSKIMAGYELNGVSTENYQDLAFTAPFLMAAQCRKAENREEEQWENALFDSVAAWRPDVYYGDTIKLMVLIGIGGDWWSPYGEK